MPELPEVETTRKGLEPLITYKKVVSAHIYKKKLRWEIPFHLKKNTQGSKYKKNLQACKVLIDPF